MKKIIFTALLLAGTLFVNAQDSMKFGVKAGFASISSKVKVAGASANGSDSGFEVGGFADIPLATSFMFEPEVLYVSAGDFNQVQVPLHLGYEFTKGFNVLAGPNLAFLSGQPDGIKSFNYGIDLGLSYDITENLVVDARYNIGLANIQENGDSDNSVKLSGFYVALGYKF